MTNIEAWAVIKGMLPVYDFNAQEEAAFKLVEEKFTSTNTGSPKLPPAIAEKLSEFVANQKDMPLEFAAVLYDNFWSLVGR